MDHLTRNFGIKHQLLTPYHPQANGMAECHIWTTKEVVNKMLFDTLTEWDMHLALIQYAINAMYYSVIGMDLVTAMFGHQLNIPKDYTSFVSGKIIDINQLTHFQDAIIHSTIIRNLSDYQFEMKKRFDDKNRLVNFRPGDSVLIRMTPMPPKDQCQFNGPYTINCITTGGSVVLQTGEGEVLPHKYALVQLHCLDSDLNWNPEYFKIDFIYDHRKWNGQTEYKVHWWGYPESADLWVTKEDFGDQSYPKVYDAKIDINGPQ